MNLNLLFPEKLTTGLFTHLLVRIARPDEVLPTSPQLPTPPRSPEPPEVPVNASSSDSSSVSISRPSNNAIITTSSTGTMTTASGSEACDNMTTSSPADYLSCVPVGRVAQVAAEAERRSRCLNSCSGGSNCGCGDLILCGGPVGIMASGRLLCSSALVDRRRAENIASVLASAEANAAHSVAGQTALHLARTVTGFLLACNHHAASAGTPPQCGYQLHKSLQNQKSAGYLSNGIANKPVNCCSYGSYQYYYSFLVPGALTRRSPLMRCLSRQPGLTRSFTEQVVRAFNRGSESTSFPFKSRPYIFIFI
ncbi:unnamed protein product [Protopolystoma xenopodis]|uniref:Uncharacterized protein n=1 Tax=Protopolystoma xenopodis TaxID=117903 RepID=A0A3S5B9Q5_9PLAT|nr:unnamed protein product [Protopolystoma xenopodis]